MYLYRYIDQCYASMVDEYDNYSVDIRVMLMQYWVYKETPCGYWIDGKWGPPARRWVSKTSKKRFAHANREDAWLSFQKRKDRQIAIYAEKLRRAKVARSRSRPDLPREQASDEDILAELGKFSNH